MIFSTSRQIGYMLTACLLANAGATSALELDAPVGGWRYSAKNTTGFVQSVQYPASLVNAERAQAHALISGKISNYQKKSKPPTLIVNGISMPLLANDDGSYARPYAFGSGSNSVEVRAPDGNRKRVQFYDARPEKLQSRLRVVLSWDTPGNDLDLHVISPDGQHVFYGAREAQNGGTLDIDVTTGYGPEIYASPAPPRGLYHVAVNYFGGSNGEEAIITLARVTIITNENTPHEKQQVFSVPMRKAGELTLVKSFIF